MSEEKKLNLVQKLIKIRKKLDYFKKTVQGSQRSNYVDPEILLGKAVKWMNEYGVLLTSNVTENPLISKMDNPTSKNKDNKDFVFSSEMKMVWHNEDDPTDTLNIAWFATGSHMTDPAMAFGGALTYTERYFIMKQFNIPTGKDDPEYHKNKIADPEDLVSSKQVNELKKMLKVIGNSPESYCKYKKIKKLENIPVSEYHQCIIDLKPMEG